ncbi:MAG: hypothetical protein DME94_11815 [Verrucomicrobia bacterium]|nr:MAG: hypothetical protein DME94_11815 [Verrucomicrobiota bacterium]
MKALFSIMVAIAVCVGSVQAGPVRTARHVAKDTAITAKNVAHSTVKGTRRAVHMRSEREAIGNLEYCRLQSIRRLMNFAASCGCR